MTRKPSWVYEEWNQLISSPEAELPLHEREARWRGLFDRCYVDGAWKVEAFDAHLVTNHGSFLAFEGSDYDQARDRAALWFEHPDASSDPYFHHYALHDLSIMELASERIEEGTRHLRQILTELKPAKSARGFVNSSLSIWLSVKKFPADAIVDRQVTDLVRTLATQARGSKRLAKSLPDEFTYRTLMDALRELSER